MNKKLFHIAESTKFAIAINLVIVINAILIGVETFYISPVIHIIQSTILGIFTLEIVFRYIAKSSVKEYFTNGWNLFDIFIVSISFIPESLMEHSEALSVFRVMRVFRILRMVETIPELQTIVTVLLRSLKSLGYTFGLLNIFMYMFAIMGVNLFRRSLDAGTEISASSPDPYGNITEAYFTLFRIMTGDGWSTIRYNLLGEGGSEDWMVTSFHVIWLALSAFLLINIVVGAVVNNYDKVMAETKHENGEDAYQQITILNDKIELLSKQIARLIRDQSQSNQSS